MEKKTFVVKRTPDFSKMPGADKGAGGAKVPGSIKSESAPKEVAIREDYIKLDSFLKFAGAALSGGEAKELVQGGKVAVNGETCTMRGKKLRAGDEVSCAGKRYRVAAETDGP